MEAELKTSFQFYKSAGLLASLVLIVAVQLLVPNRLSIRTLISNWFVNTPLALIDAALLSMLCGACVCTWAVTVREHGFGLFEATKVPYTIQLPVTVLVLDLVAYLWHRANHRWSFLWRLHAVHHSDVHCDASTAFRFHPGELLISIGVRLVMVTLTGLPLLGLIAFELIFGFFNLLVHSDIRFPLGPERRLGWVFVTPSLHRMHHSERPEIHNTNFGTILSVWDRLWHTFLDGDADTPVTLGLPGQHGRALGLGETLQLPLRKGISS
jgi:sterol desaturase/sphingolipid hydroxylase (fatty acid hydroxylase superfamily)